MFSQNIAAVKNQFQLRIANSDWKDLPLPVKELRDIIREVRGLPHNKRQVKALYELSQMVREYHGALSRFDNFHSVAKEDYEIEQFADDVLTLKYSFTLLQQDPNSPDKPYRGKTNVMRAPRVCEGKIKIMPGN